MSSRATASSAYAGSAATGAPSTSSLPPVTPHKKYKRKSVAPLSTKQFDRMTKQLLAVQHSTRGEGGSPIAEEGEDRPSGAGNAAADVLARLDLNAQSDTDAERAIGDGPRRTVVSSSSNRLVDGQLTRDSQTVTTAEQTTHWLKRAKGLGVESGPGGLTKRPGQGPDGIRLAMAAAKGLQGRKEGESKEL